MEENYPETQENFTEFEETVSLTDKEIFNKIWTSPREVFKYINDFKYDKHVTLLLLLGGISRAFDRASMKNMGDSLSLLEIILFSIVIGAIGGWISYYIYASLISWTGKWLKGQGNSESIIRILAFSLIPGITAMVLLIPQFMIYGNNIFQENGDISSAGIVLNIIFYSCLIVEFALGIWSLVLCVIGISVVQKFSIGKSILNIFLPILIIIVPLFLILFLVMK